MSLPFPNRGSNLSGSGEGPCSDQAGTPAAPLTAGAAAPPQAAAPAEAVISPARAFAHSRQLGDPPSEALSDLLRYARLVKPFPIRRLSDVLYHVGADATVINALLINAQISQPSDPDVWVETLEHMLDTLWSLGQRCEEAAVHLNRMIDEADTQAERGEAAIRAIIAGLRAS